MFKKIAGLFLAAAVMCSSAAITASAAEAEDDAAVAAADQSGEVSADGSSDVSANGSSEVEAGNVIKFDVKKSGWSNVKTVFCHTWKVDGELPVWQSKKERCKYDPSTGIATYDLSKANYQISKSDGKNYLVIFSANTGMQTYDTVMSGDCIGDTMYCTGEQIENPVDSEKKANVAKWENHSDCGPQKKITSTGKIVGSALPEGQTDAVMLAQYLIDYYDDEAKASLTQNLLDTLKVSPVDVMGAVTDKLNATNNADKDKIAPAVEKILSTCTDPTTGSGSNNGGSGSGSASGSGSGSGSGSSSNGSNGGSGSSGSGSSGSGSSSTGAVKSGVETTIVFVMAGLMVSAAGVMFLARKKREE
ncbi:LPXTG cell wall anchor domain-containing protein [Ruminococcus bromii]|uniref:LPXTG cell wall anchor domain-containing protein n=1 Tax=Ruminococcus bromii TaxID=40518 RepID=UPI00241FA615|nr:LPXTG cell wall anchor domain-containing protein [Ruminococcus bromii]